MSFFTQRQQKCTCRWVLWQEITYKCILPCRYPPFTAQSSIIIKSTKTFFATCEPSRVRPADAGALSQGAQGPVVMSQHNVVQPAIQEHLNLEKPVALFCRLTFRTLDKSAGSRLKLEEDKLFCGMYLQFQFNDINYSKLPFKLYCTMTNLPLKENCIMTLL